MNCNYGNVGGKALKIFYICDREYPYFLNKKYVVGIGYGYKCKNGFCTNRECIKVFVTKKVPSNTIPIKDLIPARYKGIETDIISGEKFMPQGLTDRIRPVQCGYSVGASVMRKGGTVGCLVTHGNKRYMLSNNHVFANFNELPIGSDIVQPSFRYGGRSPADLVAKLSKYIELKRETAFRKPTNYVDAAMAEVVDNSIASSSIALIGMPKAPAAASVGQEVKKVGATTALTNGTITAIKATYEADYEPRNVLFKDQIITTHMSMSGDSGSVLVNNDNHVLGLLLGATDTYSVFNDIHKVLSLLGVTIITS